MATADWKDWQMLSCKNKYRAKLIAQKHNKKKNKPNNFSALKINQRQNTIDLLPVRTSMDLGVSHQTVKANLAFAAGCSTRKQGHPVQASFTS